MSTNYGLHVHGKIRVFRKDKEVQGQNKKSYTISDVWINVSEQNEDKSYFNRSMNLIFKKGLPLPTNNSVILINESFPMITGNGDYRKIALYVGEWEEAAEEGKK